jgi:hypothetical protein
VGIANDTSVTSRPFSVVAFVLTRSASICLLAVVASSFARTSAKKVINQSVAPAAA